MKYCPKCNKEYEVGNFCENCENEDGSPVRLEEKVEKVSCTRCGKQYPVGTKFCSECGIKLGVAFRSVTEGISMGDKNVIAGDVIGKKEEYNITGNATIVHNEDETKKTAKCHICGSVIQRINGYDCPDCGEFTCEECFDKKERVCKACVENHININEQQYRIKVIECLSNDARIDADEFSDLSNLAQKLGISAFRASVIQNEIRENSSSKELTTFEKLNLDKAANLFYDEGKIKEAIDLVEPIYEKRKNIEEVLNLYLPLLAENDFYEAKKIIENLHFDCLGAYLTEILIDLKNRDFSKIEQKIYQAEQMWPDSMILKCHKILYHLVLYRQFKSEEWMEKAENLLKKLEDSENKLEKSWKLKVQCMVNQLNGTFSLDVNKEFCRENHIYYYFLNDNILMLKKATVGNSIDCNFSSVQEALDMIKDNGTVYVKPGIYKEQLSFNRPVKLIGCQSNISDKASSELPLIVMNYEENCKINVPVTIEGIVFTHNERLEFNNLRNYVNEKNDIAAPSNPGNYGEDNFQTMLWVNSDSVLTNIAVLEAENCGITFSNGSASLQNSFVCRTKNVGIYCVEKSVPTIKHTTVSNSYFPSIASEGNSNPYFEDCISENSKSHGIVIEENAGGRYENCEIYDNKSNGLHISDKATPEITGCKIHDNKTTGKPYTGIAVFKDSNPIITDCEVYNHLFSGIVIVGNASGRYKNCNIHDNNGEGLLIAGKATPKITGCKIHDNKIIGENHCGFFVMGDSNPIITDCVVYNHLNAGINIIENASGRYEKCIIHGNEGSGIAIQNTAESKISGCEIYDNKSNGLYISDKATPEITGCKIHDNKMTGYLYSGIAVIGDSNPVITDCEVYNHLSCGILIEQNAGGRYENCNIHNNKGKALYNASQSHIISNSIKEYSNGK